MQTIQVRRSEEIASKVAMVVATTGCTRMVAFGYLEARHGDVAGACEAWQRDHQYSLAAIVTRRLPPSLDASD